MGSGRRDEPDAGDGDAIEALIAEYLQLHDRGAAPNLEAWCRSHGDRAGRLQRGLEAVLALGAAPTQPAHGTASGPLPAGILGEFRLLHRLGAGAMGEVYLAEQLSLQRKVALKLVRPDLVGDPRALARFRREAEAAARLQHPGIVAVHAFGQQDGTPYCAMEYVDGCTLAAVLGRLRRRSPDALAAGELACDTPAAPRATDGGAGWRRAAASLVRDLARALQHAHDQGVVHRDIKPGNILLGRDGRARLADFGLARLVDQVAATRTGTVVGTPQYMSPEQVDPARGAAGPLSDVYSLGVVLYQLLTLRLPFEHERMADLFQAILVREPPALRRVQPGIDADLEAVVLKAIERDPADRYASAGRLADDLDRHLLGKATAARPLGSAGRLRRWYQRLQPPTLLLVTFVAAAAWFLVDARMLVPRARLDESLHVSRALGLLCVAGLSLALVSRATRRLLPRSRLALAGIALVVTAGTAIGMASIQRSFVTDTAIRLQRARERADLATLLLTTPVNAVLEAPGKARDWEGLMWRDDHLVLARCYLANGRTQLAGPHVAAVVRADGATPAALALQAALEAANGQFEAAERFEDMLRALAADASSEARWLEAAVIFSDVKRWSLAEKAGRNAMAVASPPKLAASMTLGSILIARCDAEEAYALLDALTPSTDAASLVLRTRIARRMGRHAEAVELLQSLQQQPLQSDATRLAVAALRFEASGQETSLLNELVDERPADLPLMHWAAAMAYVHEDYRRALDLYERLVKACEPSEDSELRNLASAGLGATRFSLWSTDAEYASPATLDEALEDIKNALDEERARQNVEPWITRFVIEFEMCNPKIPRAGRVPENQTDDLRRLLAILELARGFNPVNAVLLNNYADLSGRLAAAENRLDGLDDAIAAAHLMTWMDERALEDAGACPTTALATSASTHYTTLSELYEQSGDSVAAIEAARKALDRQPSGTPAWHRRHARLEALLAAAGTAGTFEPR